MGKSWRELGIQKGSWDQHLRRFGKSMFWGKTRGVAVDEPDVAHPSPRKKAKRPYVVQFWRVRFCTVPKWTKIGRYETLKQAEQAFASYAHRWASRSIRLVNTDTGEIINASEAQP